MKIDNKVLWVPICFGLPAFHAAFGFAIAVILGGSYNITLPLGLMIVAVLIIYRKYALDEYSTKIPLIAGGPYSYLIVKGLPDGVLESILKVVDSNQLVSITMPQDKMLRACFKRYISIKGGFVEFIEGIEFKLEGKPLGARCLLLSYRKKSELQDAISHLLSKGWKIQGEQSVDANLIDRVYTQTMLFEG